MSTWMITGAAGFIGYHLTALLAERGERVIAVDNLNNYYDPNLKRARMAQWHAAGLNLDFEQLDLCDEQGVREVFERHRPSTVVHLAAQAGVRHSIHHPHSYAQSNLVAFLHVLEACRHADVSHLVYASSSSVYGAHSRVPFSEHDPADHPVSLYAATKRANELMAHSYSHLYALPSTGLRFFTVYGPWGRPDMAYYSFAQAIFDGLPIRVFDQGRGVRDFTYVDDIVEATAEIAMTPPQPNPNWSSGRGDLATSSAPWRLYNIGSGQPATVLELVGHLEGLIGKRAVLDFLPAQPGDVPRTQADVTDLGEHVGVLPSIELQTGLERFVHWFAAYRSARRFVVSVEDTGPAL
jgi:UDP-glucuronate 4-epimerase